MRRISGTLAAAIVGAIVGALVMLSIDGVTRDVPPTSLPIPNPTEDERRDVITKPPGPRGRTLVLAWSPGGLPRRTERVLEQIKGVEATTTVHAGLDWITRSKTADGTVVDDPSGGLMIPIEVAAVDPQDYADFVPASERAAVESLSAGEALLARTSARLRGGAEGLRIKMASSTVTATATVDDVTANGYEALISTPPPAAWERVDRYVIVRATRASLRNRIERKIRSLLAPDKVLRIRVQGETPFLRYGDAVLPQLRIKEVFGEFAARPLPSGAIEVDPTWRRRNIVTRTVPILGDVLCHRDLFPQLRRALRVVRSEGLAFTIDPGDFGGCYSPRFIDSNPGGRLSHHSWGIAIDLNVTANRPGTRSDQDPRLVQILERAGFSWGGRWLVPDPMHFEWVR